MSKYFVECTGILYLAAINYTFVNTFSNKRRPDRFGKRWGLPVSVNEDGTSATEPLSMFQYRMGMGKRAWGFEDLKNYFAHRSLGKKRSDLTEETILN